MRILQHSLRNCAYVACNPARQAPARITQNFSKHSTFNNFSKITLRLVTREPRPKLYSETPENESVEDNFFNGVMGFLFAIPSPLQVQRAQQIERIKKMKQIRDSEQKLADSDQKLSAAVTTCLAKYIQIIESGYRKLASRAAFVWMQLKIFVLPTEVSKRREEKIGLKERNKLEREELWKELLREEPKLSECLCAYAPGLDTDMIASKLLYFVATAIVPYINTPLLLSTKQKRLQNSMSFCQKTRITSSERVKRELSLCQR